MKQKLQNRLKNEKGLTLVELLAVIVILGIIAAIAVPSIGGILDNTKVKAAHADAQNVLAAASLYFADNTGTTGTDASSVTLSVLKTDGYIESEGTFLTSSAVTVSKVDGGSNTITGLATWKTGKTVEYTGATTKDISAAGTKATSTGATKVKIIR